MTLDINTIRTNLFTDINSHITSGTYVINNPNNVHPSFNDHQFRSEGAPQIIISDIIISEKQLTLGRKGLYEIPFSLMFHIYHTSAANARTIADEVMSKFRGAGKAFLRTLKFKRLSWENDDYERVAYGPKRSVHIYHMNLVGVFISGE